MGARLFTKLEDPQEILRAARDAVAWDFPRPVHDVEIDQADWFRYGDSVVFWFEHYEISSTWFIHLAVSPEFRKRWGVSRWLRFIDNYAKGQGASEIGFVRCDGSEHSENYLRRLGWVETDYGLARAL